MKSARHYMALLILMLVPEGLCLAQDDEPKVRVLDEIVAKVNDEIITLTDLRKMESGLRRDLRQQINDRTEADKQFEERRKTILKTMIRNKLLVQKAEDLGMTANVDSDVAATIEQIRVDNGIPNMEVFSQALQQQGSSMAEFRRNVRESMIRNMVLRQFVYSKITLLTPEVEAYYKEHVEEFTEAAEVELAEILFLSEGKSRAAVRQKAEAVLEKLRQGEPFEELARQHSEGPTAANGGPIGSFVKGSMSEDLEAVAFQLEEGEVSDLVEADYGFQIIKVIKRSQPRVKSMDEVRPQIADALMQRKAGPETEEYIKQLVRESYVYVSPKYAGKYDVEGLI